MRGHRFRVAAAGVAVCGALLVAGCGDSDDETAATSTTTTAADRPEPSGPVRVRETFRSFPKGPVLGPAGFKPAVEFEVPAGWFGVGEDAGFGISAGSASTPEAARASIFVDALDIPFGQAVAKFEGLKTLDAGPPEPTTIGSYDGVTYDADVRGEHAPLEALGTGADIPGDLAGQQTFLDAGGTTVLIRVEAQPSDKTALAEALDVLKTFRFGSQSG